MKRRLASASKAKQGEVERSVQVSSVGPTCPNGKLNPSGPEGQKAIKLSHQQPQICGGESLVEIGRLPQVGRGGSCPGGA